MKLSLILSLVIVMTFSTLAFATLTCSFDLEDASISNNTLYDNGGTFNLEKQDDGLYPVLSTAQKQGDSYSVRVEAPTNNSTNSNDRSEGVFNSGAKLFSAARYMSLWVYVPSSTSIEDEFIIITQGKTAAGVGKPPNFDLYLKNYNGQSNQWMTAVQNDDTIGGGGTLSPIVCNGSMPKDTWVKFTLGWKGDAFGNNGWYKVWKDDVFVADYTGKLGYTDSPDSTSLRVGVYQQNIFPAAAGASVLYFDDVKYGTTLADVGGGGLSNLVPSATLSVDSTYSTFTKDKAVDGIKNTTDSRWVSGDGESHWFQLDWASNKTISNVKVWSGAMDSLGWQINNFNIQYWNGSS